MVVSSGLFFNRTGALLLIARTRPAGHHHAFDAAAAVELAAAGDDAELGAGHGTVHGLAGELVLRVLLILVTRNATTVPSWRCTSIGSPGCRSRSR